MPIVEYNTYYDGTLEDDIVSQRPWIIEWNNVDGNRTWYGITLWPKPTKKITTDWVAMTWMAHTNSTNEDYVLYVWNDWTDGYIYKANSTDDTPEKVVTTTDAPYGCLLESVIYFEGDFVILWRTVTGYNDIYVHYIGSGDVSTWNWGAMNYASLIDKGSNKYTPPMLAFWNFLFIGQSNWLIIFNWSTVTDKIGWIDWSVTWLTLHGTTIVIYADDRWVGKVYYRDWVSTSFSSSQELPFVPLKVQGAWKIDYITSTDGDLYIWSGYDTQLAVKYTKSRRLNDNSDYQEKFNFDYDFPLIWTMMQSAMNNLYLVWNTSEIHKYWQLTTWLPKTIHKVLTEDNTNTDLDTIYALSYLPIEKSLFYSYKQWTTYWIDYMDLDNLTTTEDWYFVTQVFRWPPNYINKIKQVRITTSYTNGDNYVKVYKRVDNASSWTEIRTINDSTATIERHEIKTNAWTWSLSDEFKDIQFKVEIHNDLQTDTPPIVHWLDLEYTIIK